jgi:succinate dehydrogenase / fumarate reductase cytochrome b subunit
LFYRGKEGQWSWIFHRLTGVGVLIFLFTHILDIYLIGFGPDMFNKVMAIYTHPVFRISEVFLFAAVLYHALNGIRIVIIDFWPNGTRYYRQMFYVVLTLFVLLMIPASYLMLRHLF